MSDFEDVNLIKAIFFDLDGTLIDSLLDLANSVNYGLASQGLPPRTAAEVQRFIGDGVQKLIARAVGEAHHALSAAVLDIFTDHYQAHCTDNTALYDGVAETLLLLQPHYRLGVLTNKSLAFSEKILRTLAIRPFFEEILGGDSLASRKPDPAGLLHLAAKWHLSPAQTVMVGDHATDIRTGRAAGARTVFCRHGIGHAQGMRPDAVIESLRELPGIIRRLNTG